MVTLLQSEQMYASTATALPLQHQFMQHWSKAKFSLLEGINLVDYSYDPDDYIRGREERSYFEREIERFRRDLDDEIRRDREDNARNLADDARRRLEADMKRMTVDDLRRIVNDPSIRVTSGGRISSRRPSGRDVIASSGQFDASNVLGQIKKPRKKNVKHCKNLSKCLEQANKELRTTKGKLRKGKTQADIMRRAHKLMKKC